MLADFSSFWEREHAPAEHCRLLATLFEHIWQDDGRVVAIKPQPAFAAYFQAYCQHAERPARHHAVPGAGATGVAPAFVTRDRDPLVNPAARRP